MQTRSKNLAMEAAVWHGVSPSPPFAQISLLVNVHCNESLVSGSRLLASVILSTESSLGLVLDIQLLPCVMEILKLCFCRTSTSHAPALLRWGHVVVGQLKVLDLDQGGIWVIQSATLLHPHHQGQLSRVTQRRCRAHPPEYCSRLREGPTLLYQPRKA